MITTRRQSREISVLINKLEAARRQLDAAIRLTFANEDTLAIHTLGAAAYRIVRDILHKRGQHDPDEILRTGIYQTAFSLAHGKLSDKEIALLKECEILYEYIFNIAENINEQQRRGMTFTLDQIHVTSSELLFHACSAYVLAGNHVTPEIAYFCMYWRQKRLGPARSRRFCARMIRVSKRYGGALPFWNT